MLITFLRARRSRAAIASLSLGCLQACYAYVPVPAGGVPRANEPVRIELTAAGTSEMARYLGPNVVGADGILSEARADGSLVVYVQFVQTANAGRQPWTGEGAVIFPREYQANVQDRVLNKRRSIVAGSALALALVTIAVLALRAGGAGGGGEQPPPPPP